LYVCFVFLDFEWHDPIEAERNASSRRVPTTVHVLSPLPSLRKYSRIQNIVRPPQNKGFTKVCLNKTPIFLSKKSVMLPLNVLTASLFWLLFVFGIRLGVSAEDYSKSSKDVVEQQEDYKFPSLDLSHEHAQLSSLIYENSKKHPNLPGDWQLEYYENRVNTGNVMVISSEFHKQIGVVFCGTDGVNDWLDDLDITMEPFGPKLHPINHKAWVHSGFNSVLFFKHVYEKTNMFERIEHSVKSVWKREGQDEYEVILSGHSLGGEILTLKFWKGHAVLFLL